MKPSSNGIFSQSTQRNAILTTGNNVGKLLVLLALLAKVDAQDDMEFSSENCNDRSDTFMILIFMMASILGITLVSFLTFLYLESTESNEESKAKLHV